MAINHRKPERDASSDARRARGGDRSDGESLERDDLSAHGVARTLMGVIERVRDATGADIIALYPCDGETGTFAAPVGVGLHPDDLYHAVEDMAEQLARYRADNNQGRVPTDLRPTHYGLSTWLLVTRRTFVAADAPREIGSTFVQRYSIRSTVALPLTVGGQSVALLMVNWSTDAAPPSKPEPTNPKTVATIEAIAHDSAPIVSQARAAEEVATYRMLANLLETLSALEVGGSPDGDPAVAVHREVSGPSAAPIADAEPALSFRSHVERALERILRTTGLHAAAIFIHDSPSADGSGHLSLLAQVGCPDSLAGVDLLSSSSGAASTVDALANDPQVRQIFAHAGYPVVTTFPLRAHEGDYGALLVASHDRLAFLYTPEATRLLLHTAADRIGGTLATHGLVQTLEETNRTLQAVGRFGEAIEKPGASQQQVLQAVATRLTDSMIPEFNFDVAAAYLLTHSSHHGTWVRLAAGDTAAGSTDAYAAGTDFSNGTASPHAASRQIREPRWVGIPERPLDARDVLSFVTSQRRIVVVAALDDEQTDNLVTGYTESELERLRVPIVRSDGTATGTVRVVVIGPADPLHRSPTRLASDATEYVDSHAFQLQGDLFEEHGHGHLLRIFVPIGGASGSSNGSSPGIAMGVLEAGYTIERRRRLERTVIEALRNCATQAASALETARLYEETRRHAQHLEVVTEVGRAIASSIDLDQTLRLIARHMARIIDTSTCQIALLEDDDSAWYGAASLDQEAQWLRQRVERPQPSIVFDVVDRRKPIVVEDVVRSEQVSPSYASIFGVQSLLLLPLLAEEDRPLGAVILGQRDKPRLFTPEEVDWAMGLAGQAAVAIDNARVHAREEDDHHIQKDFVLIGFGVWGQKAYTHLLTLKQFFNFKTYVVEQDTPARRAALAELETQVINHGDAIYWDSPQLPALTALTRDLEPSCYVITYIATPAETHLSTVKKYYDLSDVILIEKPLGAPLDQYRAFLESVDGHAQLVAADHYYFKLEVLLLQLLLTEERNLSSFLDGVEQIEIELLEEQPLAGTAAEIGIIADMMPHAFAILSLFTPLDRLCLDDTLPLQIGCYQPPAADKETYARLFGYYQHSGRQVRVIIDAGKGIANSKWIRLVGERRQGGRRSFYKFDFGQGIAIDGTQANLRAATRPIRQPGVPENAHLTMLRHVIEKKHPAVGILAIREAMRSNQRIQELEEMAAALRAAGTCTPYQQGRRPVFPEEASRFR